MELKDSVILITGGAIRLGRAHGLYLARRGANIAFSHLPGEPWAQTQREIQACGVQCTATELDLMDVPGLQRWVAAIYQRFGRRDVLINNASPWLVRPFLELTEAEWDISLGVNVKAAFFCAQAVAPIMLGQGRGVIINITDLSAYRVATHLSHHAVGKAGTVQLTHCLAAELGPAVRVAAVAPGPVLMPPSFTAEQWQAAAEHTLLKRTGSPEDVSHLIAFLIEHDFMTGHVYFVDGGDLHG